MHSPEQFSEIPPSLEELKGQLDPLRMEIDQLRERITQHTLLERPVEELEATLAERMREMDEISYSLMRAQNATHTEKDVSDGTGAIRVTSPTSRQ